MQRILFMTFLLAFSISIFARAESQPCPSALFLNIHHRNVDVVDFLLKQGVDPNIPLEGCREAFPEKMRLYPEGVTPAHVAMYYPDYPWYGEKGASQLIYELLEGEHADTDIEDANGRTAESLYDQVSRIIESNRHRR